MGATVGVLWAGVMAPVGGVAVGRADVVDVLVDPIVESVLAALGVGGLADVGSATSMPADVLGGLDAALVGVVQDLNNVVNGVAQDWITSPIGGPVDEVINTPFVLLFGRDLIGNGINGFTGTNDSLLGSSGLFGNLSDGGFLIGNGGTGATGVAGVDGVPAGLGGRPG
ncbi:hypothetical protein [Mycobacterium botniense]|uniref:Uncharacterized protein n=1 Tax=Mycobacterium botniense TaxID=84962 RepID=A0A7I9XSK6_9MYCO|nr:hypothetical protein [Mycobacterium botniense]GFG72982.1 hypothetical protein MBOT_03470 [Mycobacterium botniense]